MYRVEPAPSIDIVVPDHRIGEALPSQANVPLYTQLFRGVGLHTALKTAYERKVTGDTLSIMSAGCSFGPETDSVLALHNRSGFGGNLAIHGFDVHPGAVQRARQAKYFLPTLQTNHETLLAVQENLAEHGFIVDLEARQELPADEFYFYRSGSMDKDDRECYLIDSEPVRQGHMVSFEEHDLVESPPPVTDVDLIYANNFLYHLHPEPARAVVRHLVSRLGNRGVLSIGGLKGAKARSMGRPESYSQVHYLDWLQELSTELQRDDDFTLVTPDDYSGSSVIFARD